MAVAPSYANRIQGGASQDCGPLVLTTNPSQPAAGAGRRRRRRAGFQIVPLRQVGGPLNTGPKIWASGI